MQWFKQQEWDLLHKVCILLINSNLVPNVSSSSVTSVPLAAEPARGPAPMATASAARVSELTNIFSSASAKEISFFSHHKMWSFEIRKLYLLRVCRFRGRFLRNQHLSLLLQHLPGDARTFLDSLSTSLIFAQVPRTTDMKLLRRRWRLLFTSYILIDLQRHLFLWESNFKLVKGD